MVEFLEDTSASKEAHCNPLILEGNGGSISCCSTFNLLNAIFKLFYTLFRCLFFY